ncbi:hypothetical protein J5N97_021015 [Dioscorea zingiberensis]|uniref:Flavin mononucleotide hydrolase 1, chloroplatic n=1 Tax=Dioscorea zingiberensis TaxID=325984 RepID=A0A9D5CGU9_9LILI|nr:hypothetical protein J5N97_021015 [Dioscorea zingiberensis]
MALLFQPSAIVPFPKLLSRTRAMATTSFAPAMAKRKLPILLFDVMDTLVRDPFYEDVPAFFKVSLKQLLEEKHPTSWIEFEKGLISEMDLAKRFFKDERPFDLEGLKECMVRGYCYIDGIEALLQNLKLNNYEMHAFTNYPIWYTLIEEKLKVSKYLPWTFCSCSIGKRKPEPDSYAEVLEQLGVDPANCVFIDDRLTNIEAAKNAGMKTDVVEWNMLQLPMISAEEKKANLFTENGSTNAESFLSLSLCCCFHVKSSMALLQHLRSQEPHLVPCPIFNSYCLESHTLFIFLNLSLFNV